MSWFATDDRFWQHRKVMRLRRSAYYAQAVAVWSLSGSWCAGDEAARDTGEVPMDVIAGLGVPDWELAVKALTEVRLFDETHDPEVIAFHDWDYWNGPGAKTKRLEKRMEADRIRQRMRRSTGLSGDVSRDQCRDQSSDQGGQSRDSHVTPGYGNGNGSASTSPNEEETNSSSRPRRRNANDGRDDVLRVCQHLADRIVDNGSNRPSITVRWLDAARLMIDLDKRTEDQIHKAIDWCQDDDFWCSRIMSMPKLREKYDTLRIQARDKREKADRNGSARGMQQPLTGSGVWDRVVGADREREPS